MNVLDGVHLHTLVGPGFSVSAFPKAGVGGGGTALEYRISVLHRIRTLHALHLYG